MKLAVKKFPYIMKCKLSIQNIREFWPFIYLQHLYIYFFR